MGKGKFLELTYCPISVCEESSACLGTISSCSAQHFFLFLIVKSVITAIMWKSTHILIDNALAIQELFILKWHRPSLPLQFSNAVYLVLVISLLIILHHPSSCPLTWLLMILLKVVTVLHWWRTQTQDLPRIVRENVSNNLFSVHVKFIIQILTG